MEFKDIIASDIGDVFFNTTEFAEDHLWDNKKILAMVDDDDLIRKYSSEFELLSKGSHCIMAPAAQFEKRPLVGSAIIFDGDLYTVDEIKDEDGVLVVFLDSARR